MSDETPSRPASPPAPGKPASWWKWLIAAAVVALVTPFVFVMVLLGAISGGQSSTVSGCRPELAAVTDGITGGGVETSAKIRDRQITNAKAIDAAVRKAGLGGRATEIAIIAAHGESTLLNVDYGDARNGVTNPDGSPTTSIGLYQQQKWWGTKAQRMDPAYATTSFLAGIDHDGIGGLVSVPNWQSREITQVTHEVQGNADATHYLRSYAPARDIITAAGIDITREGEDGAAGGTTTVGDIDAAAESCGAGNGTASTVNAGQANNDYPWKSRTPGPGVYVAGPLNFFYGECTSFVAWRLNRDLGGTATAPFEFTNNTGGVIKGNGADWRSAWEQLGWKVSQKPVEGAVAWWGPNGAAGIGPAGHVAYVQSVTGDSAHIEEYNNVGLAPPGHKYSQRTIAASEANAFLHPPPKDSK